MRGSDHGVGLKSWIDSPALAHQMGERGRQQVLQRYAQTRITDVVEGVYLRARQRAQANQSVVAPTSNG